MKFAIYSLFLALASAQCDENFTIRSQSDASRLSGCSKFEGQLTIDDVSETSISLSGLKSISGSLVIQNNFSLKSISFDSLTSVSDNFQLQNNTELIGISFPALTDVDNFQIIYNPNLKQASMGVINKVNNYQIIQTSLDQIAPVSAKIITNIEITDNSFLIPIEFPDLVNNTGYINIVNNNPSATVSFPNLMSIRGNATFRNLDGFEAKNLTTVSNTLNILGNTFEKISFKNLSTMEKDLSITNNTGLSSIEIPILKDLGGGLQILSNDKLTEISTNSFTKLEFIKGGVTLEGAFENVVFPALKRVDGAFKLTTTSSNITCSAFTTKFKPIVKGTFKCDAAKGSNSGNSSTADKNNAVSNLTHSYATTLVVAFLSFAIGSKYFI
ncbi:hypothetical protein BB561_005567 [Smittium simulii]|uniref:Receptor L-domain domain-containing protein n=1 Tax=Smittium simulii TaxID=133385 RepID=A0A2T9Y9P8_9FUNG|nr:hypothetical protein BB561_005567 [Smittium simulii]